MKKIKKSRHLKLVAPARRYRAVRLACGLVIVLALAISAFELATRL